MWLLMPAITLLRALPLMRLRSRQVSHWSPVQRFAWRGRWLFLIEETLPAHVISAFTGLVE